MGMAAASSGIGCGAVKSHDRPLLGGKRGRGEVSREEVEEEEQQGSGHSSEDEDEMYGAGSAGP
jgi:hypothetical protein